MSDIQPEKPPKELERKHYKWIAKKNKERRILNDKVFNEFNRLIREEWDEVEAIDSLSERFELSPRQIRNIIAKKSGSASLATRSFAEAKILGTIGKLATDAEEVCRRCDDEIGEYLGKQDEDWVEIEQTDTVGGKGGGSVSTKKVPVREARRRAEDRKLQTQERFLSVVGTLTRQNVININMDSGDRSRSLEDIEAEMKELQKSLKIEGGNPVD